jgi:hypothetical protein
LNLRQLSDLAPWEWPDNAAELVTDTLTNRQAPEAERLLAAELAGDMTILNEKIGGELLTIVESDKEPTELRCSAAIALGPGLEEVDLEDYDDPYDSPALSEAFANKIQQTFHTLYLEEKAPRDVRRAALEASVRNSQEWHTGAVQAAYGSSDRDWRLTAVFCMEFVRGFEDQILESLQSEDSDIVFHAVNAAGNWELDAAWPTIARMVKSAKTEKQLRLAAIEAVASIRPSETEILEPLIDSYDEDISEAAMDALTEAGFAAEDEEGEDDFEEDDFDFDEEDEEDNEDDEDDKS